MKSSNSELIKNELFKESTELYAKTLAA
jgi:hypothetical protein